jgi:glycosyltransferase involved in cell wall biosynthesis
MTDVAVVICTRNRPALLRNALASLAAQTLPRDRWEVVVVDNGDGSGIAVAQSLGVECCVREEREGLSAARNVGWRATLAGLVGFLDDDAEAEADWLEQAVGVAGRTRAAAVGGPILPLYEVAPPAWFRDEYEQRSLGEAERPTERTEHLSGSNVFVRRSLLESLGGFDERLGMRGDSLGVGEESALLQSIAAKPGHRIIYSPKLRVRHRVSPEKLSVRYQLRRAAASGEAWAVQRDAKPPVKPLRIAADFVVAIAIGLRALARFRRPWRRWAVDELAPAAGRLGSIKGHLG